MHPFPGARTQPRRRFVALVTLVAIAGFATACGGAATSSPPATDSSPAPSGEACVSAPAPPADQEGWTTAPEEPSVFPVIVNSSGSLTCGPNRLVFTFLDPDNRTVAAPDRTASIAIYNRGRDGNVPVQTVDGTFLWGIENERGFYVANVEFPEAGEWGAEFATAVGDAAPETIRLTFQVATSSPVVRVGDEAPASETPTADDVDGDLARISTDDEPDPALYELSVTDALDAGEPFVLAFATPKFCVTAQCGPTLDQVKPLAAEHPDVVFIHAEPYEMEFKDGALQPLRDAGGALVPTQAVFDWGLLSEPWVFVVDRQGVITASFEGVLGTAELEAAIEAVE